MSDLRQRLLANTQANKERLKEMGENTPSPERETTPAYEKAFNDSRKGAKPIPPVHSAAIEPEPVLQHAADPIEEKDAGKPEDAPTAEDTRASEVEDIPDDVVEMVASVPVRIASVEPPKQTKSHAGQKDDPVEEEPMTDEELAEYAEELDEDLNPDSDTLSRARAKTATYKTSDGKTKRLTAQQEKFCQLRSEGKRQIEAYEASYDCSNMERTTSGPAASRLEKTPHVAARIAALKAAVRHQIYYDADLVRREVIDALVDVMRDGQKDSDRVAAAKALGSMKHVKLWDTKALDKDDDYQELSDDEMLARISRSLKLDS